MAEEVDQKPDQNKKTARQVYQVIGRQQNQKPTVEYDVSEQRY